MAQYLISGIWKDEDDVISAYLFHTIEGDSLGKYVKKTKAEAIALLEISGNKAMTMMWNYSKTEWTAGELVQVVNGADGKYLRTNPDNKLTDNLQHLIDFGWVIP